MTRSIPSLRNEAVEVHAGESDAKVLVTCEHASQRLPPPWRWPDADRRLIDTHWAFDLGAAELALDLAVSMRASAVLSRFSRLLVDPNRPEDADTLCRDRADGLPILLNTTLLDDAERVRRIERFHRPYHHALDRAVAASSAPILCAMHTFTPEYEGTRRVLEIGVLFDREEALADWLVEGLVRRGLRAERNEPYSGKAGLMYSVDRHAALHSRRAIELEVRQDLATDPLFRRDLDEILRELFQDA